MKAVQFSLFEAAPKIRWGAHHGYTPSIFWLIKGVRAVESDPMTFIRDEYWMRLGVSKSMGESLKFWCEAFKLIHSKDVQGRYYQPTPFAKALLDEKTGDPYLEDVQSLWILHWKLLQSPCLLPTWEWFFTRFYSNEFTEAYLLDELKKHYQREAIKVSPNTVAADVKCLLKMYMDWTGSSARSIEEEIMRPFPELGYISMNPSFPKDDKHYRINVGRKEGITPAVFLHLCIQYIKKMGISCGSVAFNTLMYEPDSPGIVLKLTISDMLELIDVGLKQIDGLQASCTADINLLQWSKPLSEIEQQVWRSINSN